MHFLNWPQKILADINRAHHGLLRGDAAYCREAPPVAITYAPHPRIDDIYEFRPHEREYDSGLPAYEPLPWDSTLPAPSTIPAPVASETLPLREFATSPAILHEPIDDVSEISRAIAGASDTTPTDGTLSVFDDSHPCNAPSDSIVSTALPDDRIDEFFSAQLPTVDEPAQEAILQPLGRSLDDYLDDQFEAAPTAPDMDPTGPPEPTAPAAYYE